MLAAKYFVVPSCSLPRGLNRPEAMANSKKIEECCNNMAVSTEYPSDRCIRPFILAQSFVNTIDSSYSELGESGHDETLVRIMVGAKLRQFESLEATLKEELSRLPNPTSMLF